MQISQRAKNIQPSATLALSTRANAMRAEGIESLRSPHKIPRQCWKSR